MTACVARGNARNWCLLRLAAAGMGTSHGRLPAPARILRPWISSPELAPHAGVSTAVAMAMRRRGSFGGGGRAAGLSLCRASDVTPKVAAEAWGPTTDKIGQGE